MARERTVDYFYESRYFLAMIDKEKKRKLPSIFALTQGNNNVVQVLFWSIEN